METAFFQSQPDLNLQGKLSANVVPKQKRAFQGRANIGTAFFVLFRPKI